MNSNNAVAKSATAASFFLSEIVGARVKLNGKKIGSLADVAIKDGDVAAEVTHLFVSRPFGARSLLIPWANVKSLNGKEAVVDIESVEKYEAEPGENMVLVKDHLLDKKVLDTEGKEVEVVYDVALVMVRGKLYVGGVDVSRYAFVRRIGLKWLTDLVYSWANRLKDETIPWKYVQPLPTEISSFKGDVKLNVLKEKLAEMHPADIADILEDLDHEQRVALFGQLDTETASDALEEIEPDVQRAILAALSKKRVAQLVNEMTPGQAADVLAVMPSTEAQKVLMLISEENRGKVRDILERHEQKIMDYAANKLMCFSPDMTVREAHELYRKEAQISDIVMYLYVVDESNKLLGIIDIRELMKADDNSKLKDIMTETLHSLNQDSTLREASAMFEKYSFRALPIVNDEGKLLGAVSYRDMVNLKHRVLE
jgi:CBS domain-containing protein/sporulation protein YlmC with PRC-barrel domain